MYVGHVCRLRGFGSQHTPEKKAKLKTLTVLCRGQNEDVLLRNKQPDLLTCLSCLAACGQRCKTGKKKKKTLVLIPVTHTHTHTSMHKVLIQHMNYENASICNILPSVFLPAVRVTPDFSSPTTQCAHVYEHLPMLSATRSSYRRTVAVL